jgi:hypothetical protein
MKILVAINSTNAKILSDTTLRWVGRLGFEVRVFVPKNKRKKYLEIVDDTNYQWYLALEPKNTIVSRTDAETYAKQHGFDLLVTIPEHLESWRKKGFFKPDEVKRPYEAIANARGEFSRKPRKRIKRFKNGTVMRRIS